MFYTYILFSQKLDKYYIGMSSNIEERVLKHNSNHKKGFTNQTNDWTLVYSESFEAKSNALKREKEIKNWKSKSRIRKMIEETI